MLVHDGDAGREMTEATDCRARDMTRAGLEVARRNLTTHAGHRQMDDSTINGQQSNEPNEVDFQATIMALTAAWGTTPDPITNPSSMRHEITNLMTLITKVGSNVTEFKAASCPNYGENQKENYIVRLAKLSDSHLYYFGEHSVYAVEPHLVFPFG
ncbi:hypothetical protein J5N97_003686 [Dioscorea zingiberensis]|uniref:Uncharacterized protein n=1 Tax=Dioscorea zingiberensis TaxID=325984 RepID=A0A9D5D760_9LILI|nr:hypothetical protein J5N97_003686 [Dioscorea zingiberensis]